MSDSFANRKIEDSFCALQTVLTAAANIAKALWGSGSKRAAQRAELRDNIGITDASPLKNVSMRNNFEHFDERLDQWWEKSQVHTYIDINWGDASILVNTEPLNMFRTFNPDTTDLTFWGQSFNLQEVVTEVRRILPNLQN
jgi:hypothetical protein